MRVWVLELHQRERNEWIVWTRGSLEEVLEDTFDQLSRHSLHDVDGLRIVWEPPEEVDDEHGAVLEAGAPGPAA